jgi:hypothetical protein
MSSQLQKLHQQITNHSSFVSLITLVRTEENTTQKTHTLSFVSCSEQEKTLRTPLLSFLYHFYQAVISSQDKSLKDSIFKKELLAVYLSAYEATTSEADRLLFKIFFIFDREAGLELSSASAFLWGKSARHNLATTQTPTLHSTRALFFDGHLFERGVLWYSVRNFPVYASRSSSEMEDNFGSSLLKEVYDPVFALPFFACMLNDAPHECRRFSELGALPYTIVALSSLDDEVRRMAYEVLGMYYSLLLSSDFRDRSQVQLLLTVFKYSIPPPPPSSSETENKEGDKMEVEISPSSSLRISSIITQFVAHSLTIITKPDHHMYLTINKVGASSSLSSFFLLYCFFILLTSVLPCPKFFLSRSKLDLKDVPLFYNTFNSSSQHFEKERSWILRLIVNGLTRYSDYKLLRRRHAFEMLMAFSDSQFSDDLTTKVRHMIAFPSSLLSVSLLHLSPTSSLLSLQLY